MKTEDFIKPMIILGCLVFIVCYLIEKPTSWDGYSSYISYAVSAVSVLFIFYERWLWRFIPWKRPPILKKHYDGKITYFDKKEQKTKNINIHVKQSLCSIKIETNTDINSSYTITASIEQEYGSYFLYYVYITNPDANVQKNNPIQHGTCRVALQNDTAILKGKYWTSGSTIGDIEWKEHK